MKSTLYVEYQGNQVNTEEFLPTAKNLWVEAGNKIKDMKQIEFYYNTEENKCYFVINDDFTGSF